MEEPGLNITKVIVPREATAINNHYEEIIKMQNKKTIEYVAIHGQMLKKFYPVHDRSFRGCGAKRPPYIKSLTDILQ